MAKVIKTEFKSTPIIVIDFETGGLDPQTCAITEVSVIAIRGDDLSEIARYEGMVIPYYNSKYQYNQVALDITGITIEMLKAKGKSIKEVAKGVLDVITKAKDEYGDGKGHKPLLSGHNITFDIGFLEHLFHEAGMIEASHKVLQGKKGFFGHYHYLHVDTITLSKILWAADRRMPNWKLETCTNKAGVALSDAHRAINDTIATKDLFVHVTKSARIGEAGGGTLTKENDVSFRKHFQL